jgi:hypothetical protein
MIGFYFMFLGEALKAKAALELEAARAAAMAKQETATAEAKAQVEAADAINALRKAAVQSEQEPLCDCPDDKCYGWTGLCKRVANNTP